MAFMIDAGPQGGEGPWLVWTPRGTQDGEIGGKTFYVRHGDGSKVETAAPAKGMVLDLSSLKTGWQESSGMKGVAPKWQWGASPSALPPKPGDDWKKGFSIKVALGKGEADTAVWEQAGTAVFSALVEMAPHLDAPAPGKCPVVKLTGTKVLEFSTGKTIQPILEVAGWVDKPDNLKAEATRIDSAPAEQPKAAPPPAASSDDDWAA